MNLYHITELEAVAIMAEHPQDKVAGGYWCRRCEGQATEHGCLTYRLAAQITTCPPQPLSVETLSR